MLAAVTLVTVTLLAPYSVPESAIGGAQAMSVLLFPAHGPGPTVAGV